MGSNASSFHDTHCHHKYTCMPRVMRVAELWNRLSREVMDAPNSDAPSSDIFKVRLDVYWSNLSQLKMSLVIARGLD